MQNTNKKLFEETPVPQAVQTMMIPTIIGALLAFNAVINLFGIGSSSMMSRALGRGDLKTVCEVHLWVFMEQL